MNKKPNIIFFFSDQQRADTICEEVTPNLCKMQSEGTTFSNAYTCQPVCGPARACLQSGVYATQNKCLINGIPLDISCTDKTLANCFNDAGYETGYIGKWHLASLGVEQYRSCGVPENLRAGYKYWLAADLLEFSSDGFHGTLWDNDCKPVEFNDIRSDCLTSYAIDFIKDNKDKPFFLFLSQLEPHHQNTSGKFECPTNAGERFKNMPYPEDLLGLDGDYESNYADYLACCSRLDFNAQRIEDTLKSLGIEDNTILVYTSDHGCHFKTRNSEYKRSCHSASTHIPLIFKGPQIPKNKRSDKVVSLIDLPPTLLKLAGIPIPQSYMGYPVFDDFERDCALIQISESHNGRCITTKQYIYSVKLVEGNSIYEDDYLYDKYKDKAEHRNLINDPQYAKIKAIMRELLIREMVNAQEPEPLILNSADVHDI